MIVRYVSDLHFEFHADGGRAFVASLPTDCDVLVLAGDVGVAAGGSLLCGMRFVLERFRGVPVLYVPGNHEFYAYGPCAWSHHEPLESLRRHAQQEVRDVCDRLRTFDNFVGGVDPWTWEHGGVRFVGATLWFGEPPRHAPRHHMTDYRVIPGLEVWSAHESERHLEFIARHADASTVVVTHHLPHPVAVAPQWQEHALNAFFVHPGAEAVVAAAQPLAWIHGHSHESLCERVGRTALLRNPFGYAPSELVGTFDPHAQLEVGARV